MITVTGDRNTVETVADLERNATVVAHHVVAHHILSAEKRIADLERQIRILEASQTITEQALDVSIADRALLRSDLDKVTRILTEVIKGLDAEREEDEDVEIEDPTATDF